MRGRGEQRKVAMEAVARGQVTGGMQHEVEAEIAATTGVDEPAGGGDGGGSSSRAGGRGHATKGGGGWSSKRWRWRRQ